MRLQRALYVRSSHHSHDRRCSRSFHTDCRISICLCLETHLISNSHVPPRRSPSSIPIPSILGRYQFDYHLNRNKMFRIPFIEIDSFVDIFESFQNSRNRSPRYRPSGPGGKSPILTLAQRCREETKPATSSGFPSYQFS